MTNRRRIGHVDVVVNSKCSHVSTGPAAEPSGRFLSSAPRGGGGWGPPLCIGKQEVGAYIYSRTYTAHGALGVLLRSITAANMVGEPVDPFRW